jgi:hypothetical protein
LVVDVAQFINNLVGKLIGMDELMATLAKGCQPGSAPPQ